jgi:hypothetical protein
MIIVETKTGNAHKVVVKPVERSDFKNLNKSRYFFDWKKEKGQELYKLCLTGSNDILGLVSIERIPEEWRLHIRLLTVSKENKGNGKQYDNIAGNLITHISKIAIMEYAELACVSLKPKEAIAQHYIDKYGMNVTGKTLSIELLEIFALINKYDHE